MSEHRIRFLAPLINFDSSCSRIELTPDTEIRKLSDYERGIINRLREQWPTIKYGNFLLECGTTATEPESEPGDYDERYGRPCIERAITILRLFKEDIIGYNFAIHPFSETEHFGYHAFFLQHYQMWMSEPTRLSERNYIIDQDEVDQFKQFFADYDDPDAFRRLSLAVDWFNKSYIEPYSLRDPLLDLMITLENLYLKGERQELRYKLGMRVAYTLATGTEGRKEIFRDIQKGYKDRSNIVHGATTPDITYEFLFRIRNYTRNSLKVFLKNPSLRDNLDDRILNG